MLCVFEWFLLEGSCDHSCVGFELLFCYILLEALMLWLLNWCAILGVIVLFVCFVGGGF